MNLSEFVQLGLALQLLIILTVVIIGTAGIIKLYWSDVTQTEHAIRRNYPIIGRFRYFFEYLGTFFRQYFFAMDREELPFNRAERGWVYRAAKNLSNMIGFGSTRDVRPAGTIIFVSGAFPQLEKSCVTSKKITIGPYCKNPYLTNSLFNISAMSYGSISKPAVLALSNGARMAGCWLNTGEGGISPHHLAGGADLVAQIGTAKYGYRDAKGNLCEKRLKEAAALPQVKMFEVKLSQGAKPGKGGILPAVKVTVEIATIRNIQPYQDSLSPNRFPEISNSQELLDFINYIRDITGKPVGFKTVLGSYEWIEALCAEINERGIESAPDFITLDSADGGSGAAPMVLMDYMGIPIKESLPKLINILSAHQLRERIKVIAAGKLITPGEVAWALCAGADFVTSARGFMFALGCIQALECHKNTCPTGITTHDAHLQKGLDPTKKSQRVYHYAAQMVTQVGMIAHSCGVSEPRQLTRRNARIVQANGQSISLEQLYASL